MSYIDETWLRTAYQAMRATLDVDSKTKEQMVQFLLDEGFWDKEKLTWEAAIARFNSCLNPNKSEFFKLGEFWALMSRFGRHHLFHAMADDFGFEVRLKPTEERHQELLERFVNAADRLEQDLASARAGLARLQAAPPAQRQLVHPGQKVHFSAGDGFDNRTAVQRMGCP